MSESGRLGERGLVRDHATLSLYSTFLTWGWFVYGFTPAVPLIADEQHISRGVAGLHGTALAAGTVLAGLGSERIARRLGRRRMILLGMAIVSVGVTAVVTGPGLVSTLAGCALAAVGGNLMLAGSQTTLLELHGPAGPAAVTEGNAFAPAFGLLAPVALGASVGAGWGWRPAVALTVVAAATAALLVARIPHTAALDTVRQLGTSARAGRLGLTYGLLLVATVSGVAIELSTTMWASDLVVEGTGAPASLATGAVAGLLVGMSVARFAVPHLARRWTAEHLLLAGYAIAAAGWLVLWTATAPWVAVLGLVVAGLGYGTHYPLGVSLLIGAAGARPDLGQARALLGIGVAIGLGPFALGTAAEAFGAHTAFVLVPLLLVVASGALLRATHPQVRA